MKDIEIIKRHLNDVIDYHEYELDRVEKTIEDLKLYLNTDLEEEEENIVRARIRKEKTIKKMIETNIERLEDVSEWLHIYFPR